jgi:hypothetical protein
LRWRVSRWQVQRSFSAGGEAGTRDDLDGDAAVVTILIKADKTA